MSLEEVEENASTETVLAESDTSTTKVSDVPKKEIVADEKHEDSDNEKKKRRRARNLGDAVFCRPLEVVVRDDRVEQAIRQLKNRMAREGVLRELKNRRHYFKPSELKRIKSREAARRRRKQARQKNSS